METNGNKQCRAGGGGAPTQAASRIICHQHIPPCKAAKAEDGSHFQNKLIGSRLVYWGGGTGATGELRPLPAL